MTPFFNSEDIERKSLLILKVLQESGEPLGARLIARRMQEQGVVMSERTVRYHLKLMDERLLTRLVGRRNGRVITATGIHELDDARVRDKLGFAISRIEMLAFRTTFDPKRKTGSVPVNISIFPRKRFADVMEAMKPAFEEGFQVSERIAVAGEGERLGDFLVPDGKIALATVCSIVINGVLLKAGIPVDSKFSGILQVKRGRLLRFSDLIYYSGCSLNPSEAFIRARMTSVRDVVSKGEGKILANYREIPVLCHPAAEKTLAALQGAGIDGVMATAISEPICQIPVDMNKVGMVLIDGLNPLACAQEAGIEIDNFAMSNVLEYEQMKNIKEFLRGRTPGRTRSASSALFQDR
ncbi:MAG: Ribonuclease R winged-helix domain protein [Syntrophaceae bacterium PtaU1.Bin231]|nr:MAG: Ribonuclease R winged-helix domain protein [Syntrophaceae bacterium PtaU1.Bin231]